MFVGVGMVAALHCQIGGKWAKLNSEDIGAWGALNEVTVLEGWGPPGKAEMQQRTASGVTAA